MTIKLIEITYTLRTLHYIKFTSINQNPKMAILRGPDLCVETSRNAAQHRFRNLIQRSLCSFLIYSNWKSQRCKLSLSKWPFTKKWQKSWMHHVFFDYFERLHLQHCDVQSECSAVYWRYLWKWFWLSIETLLEIVSEERNGP